METMDITKIDEIVNDYIRNLYKGTEEAIVKIIDPDTIPREVELIQVSCIRCHHQWYIRKNRFPRFCPECGSWYWNSPTKRELGFEYFGQRVYAFCSRCGDWLQFNYQRKRKNGDIIKKLLCGNCGLNSSINITTNERDVRPKQNYGNETRHNRIILVEIPSVVAKFTKGK